MAWYPDAIKRPVELFNRPVQNRGKVKPNVLVLHVAVSVGSTLYNYFSRPGSQSCSHFYVRLDGVIEQYIDTALRSAAEQQGSQRAISIETAGGTKPATVETEPWTAAQLESLAKLAAWVNEVHGIPLVSTPDSQSTTAGVSWHRRGIKGNWTGAQKTVSWVAGEIWSGNGKSCPGYTKITQVNGIIARARQLVTGGSGGGITPIIRRSKQMLGLTINDGQGRYGPKGQQYWATFDGRNFIELSREDADAASGAIGATFGNFTYDAWEKYKAAGKASSGCKGGALPDTVELGQDTIKKLTAPKKGVIEL